jgi:hypothetical protein
MHHRNCRISHLLLIFHLTTFSFLISSSGRLYGLVVRVPGYRSRGPGSMPAVLPDILRSSGSGMGSSQPHECLEEKVAAPVQKTENTALGIHQAGHVSPSIRKTLALTSLTSRGRSAGIVSSRTQATEFFTSSSKTIFSGISLIIPSCERVS